LSLTEGEAGREGKRGEFSFGFTKGREKQARKWSPTE